MGAGVRGHRHQRRYQDVTALRKDLMLSQQSANSKIPKEAWPTNAAARCRWLGGRESNPDSLVQSQLSYH